MTKTDQQAHPDTLAQVFELDGIYHHPIQAYQQLRNKLANPYLLVDDPDQSVYETAERLLDQLATDNLLADKYIALVNYKKALDRLSLHTVEEIPSHD